MQFSKPYAYPWRTRLPGEEKKKQEESDFVHHKKMSRRYPSSSVNREDEALSCRDSDARTNIAMIAMFVYGHVWATLHQYNSSMRLRRYSSRLFSNFHAHRKL